MLRKLLWVGDAGCDSGFAKCTHNTLPAFIQRGWEVVVLGLNYCGDPHRYPYQIFPARTGGDLLGSKRLLELVDKERPTMVVIQNDPWNFKHYKWMLGQLVTPPPVVAAVAIDGKNAMGKALNWMDHAIFWTEFARQEAIIGGMTIPSGVVPLGVDRNVFHPGDQFEARQQVGLHNELPGDAFIVLNINRNQPRKRLDLTMQYFGEWIKTRQVANAYLYLHVCPTGDVGIAVEQLAAYYGFNSTRETSRLILAQPEVFKGASEAHVAATMRAADVMMSTTHGEGWGLPALEGMACGIPQVLPDWSAYGDWAREAALMVPCTTTSISFGGPNVIGGVPDKEFFIRRLDLLYRDHEVRRTHRELSLRLANRPEYRWENIGQRFVEQVELAEREFVYA